MDSETIIEMYIKKVGYKPEAILWTRRGVVPKYNTVEQVVKALYYSSTRAEAGARLGYGQTQSPGTIKGLEKALRERAGTLFFKWRKQLKEARKLGKKATPYLYENWFEYLDRDLDAIRLYQHITPPSLYT